MTEPDDSSLEAEIASRLYASRLDLTGRWLTRLTARVDLHPNRIFPTDALLDHMPLLIAGVAEHVQSRDQPVVADSAVVTHARELGGLRYGQGFDEQEVLKEFEILGGILLDFLTESMSDLGTAYPAERVFACTKRLFQALVIVQQAAMTQYLQLTRERVREREERLRAFNRALTHEFRNRIGAAMGAGQILELANLGETERSQLTSVIVRNMESMRLVLENLLELSRLTSDTRQQRHVRLPEAVDESLRQLRDMAASRGVTIEVAPDLPLVEVPASAVELSIANLVSNSIKYADPRTPARWVRVGARVTAAEDGTPTEIVIEVSDNGIGVPEAARDNLFQRLFRADNARASGVDGTGLGLNIVRETIESLGGRVWAEFGRPGTTFAVALPCRRVSDLAVLGAATRSIVTESR